MTEAAETIQGKKLADRYTLLDKLGAGGQGEVWRAHDATRGVDIALKVLNPTNRASEAWSALEREYAIANLLSHPSILKVFAPERIGEVMLLPMELASGGDLRRLRGAGFLEIVPVLLEVAQALEHAHERGVVHRDLKPGNILFDARGRARLADFGVAETAMTTVGPPPSAASAAAATRDTNRHGYSPFTASPAQLRGEPPTPADDVYGLGALAYELLSGYPPYYPHFDKKRAMEERVPTLVPTRQIPPLLGTLVMHMLAKDPKRRPRTMREVIDELDASLNDTLTYDFENVSPATPTASEAIIAAAVRATRGTRDPDSDMSGSHPGPVAWSPDGPDRRANPDRRGRRREDRAPQAPPAAVTPARETFADAPSAMESKLVGSPTGDVSSGHGSKGTETRPMRRTGADALARIDAALERVAAETASHPKPSIIAPAMPGDTVMQPMPSRSASPTPTDAASSPPAAAYVSPAPPPAPVDQTRYSNFAARILADAAARPRTSYFASETSAETPSKVKAPPPDMSAGDTMILPRLSQPAPMTPAEASTIVAAARAAAKQAEAPRYDSSQTVALPPLDWDTSQTVALPPLPMDYKPPEEVRKSAPSDRSNYASAARSATPAQRSEPASSRAAGQPSSSSGSAPSISARTTGTAPKIEPLPVGRSKSMWPIEGKVSSAAPQPTVATGRSALQSAASSATAGTQQKAASAELQPESTTARASLFASGLDASQSHSNLFVDQQQPNTRQFNAVSHQSTLGDVTAILPEFGQGNITVGTYPDPTSILTRDTVHTVPMRPKWGEMTLEGLPKISRLEPIRVRRWPWVVFGLAAGVAAAVYFWRPALRLQKLPQAVVAVVEPSKAITSNASATTDSAGKTSQSATGSGFAGSPNGSTAMQPLDSKGARPGAQKDSLAPAASAVPAATAEASAPTAFTPADDQSLHEMRQSFDSRLAALQTRGAGVWGGREFALARARAAESVGAYDAGNPRLAQERLTAATQMLDLVENKAPQAFSAQIAAGERALDAGQQEVAAQAFDLARRINPTDRRASVGQRRAQNLSAVLPLLADAQNAEAAHDFARAAQDYSQALSLDPSNATAKAGQARANAAFGDDSYASAVGSGFAALGAGRLDEAHEAFVKARALNPKGAEAAEGLRRVGFALTARGFASMRQRAAGLEAQERWEEAERTYEDVLAADSSLAFAQQGKVRATSRADLSLRLQQLIDRPDRLSSPGVREDARALLETAMAQSPQGPVIRSQIARLEGLLPGFDRPVRLSLVSDNSTKVAISSIGEFGAFAHRDIQLRPGKYTVVGTRDGFRDVRREITVAPGQDSQTVRVTCSEPI